MGIGGGELGHLQREARGVGAVEWRGLGWATNLREVGGGG